MSVQRGNVRKTKTQKHANKRSFVNNKYDTSLTTQLINNLQVTNVCQRCKDCIEWKIKYKKYKPLTVPGKCVRCSARNVKRAYHIVCAGCSTASGVCAKCNEKKDDVVRE